MKFITNGTEENHFIIIRDKLLTSQEVFIAVAFLKSSGLKLLLPSIKELLKNGNKITLIAGQNFGLTEPDALLSLFYISKKLPNCSLFLAKANSANTVFHHKLYLFKHNEKTSIMSGSANITSGGLTTNKESSILEECTTSDQLWKDALDHFDSLVSSDNADAVNLLVIRQYETFYNQQRLHNQQARAIPSKTTAQLNFNYHTLKRHLDSFGRENLEEKFKSKATRYKRAKLVLDKIAEDENLTEKKFSSLLDELVGSQGNMNLKLWDSGSLFRLRHKVYPHFKKFQLLVQYIRDNKRHSSDVVFQNAILMVKPITGASANYVSEIMMTYNKRDFANINRNPISVLRLEAGVDLKKHSSLYKGVNYFDYCELIKEISDMLSLRNMLEADSLFNEIYWYIK